MDSFSRDPFGDDVVATSQRSRARDSLFLMARLRFDGEASVRDVRVRNLSEGGLMADCDRVMDTGTAVSLTVRGLGDIAGKVAWCTEGRIGISLDRKIDPKKARKPIGSAPRG